MARPLDRSRTAATITGAAHTRDRGSNGLTGLLLDGVLPLLLLLPGERQTGDYGTGYSGQMDCQGITRQVALEYTSAEVGTNWRGAIL
jgi:hypothetical protein